MIKKPNLTTKPGYKNGYEAGAANQPRKSPHRDGTASEDVWFAGYDAFLDNGKPPEEPRKKRTKAEMEEARTAPPKSTLPESMRRTNVPTFNPTPRSDGMLEHMFAAKKTLDAETDVELREILHMELADLEWLAYIESGEKPSKRWEEYKTERGLNFDKKVA